MQWLHSWGTGVGKFPLDLVGDRLMTCARGSSGTSISEWVLAMMLAFEKNIPDVWISEPSDSWHHRRTWEPVWPHRGRRRLWRDRAERGETRATAFDMQVVALRRARQVPSPIAGVQMLDSLAELLAVSDHVVLAAPLTAETYHLIDQESLRHVRHGAHLVNVARGGLVDLTTLLGALDGGRVAMASLDCIDPEPLYLPVPREP